jgi:ribonuclease-3
MTKEREGLSQLQESLRYVFSDPALLKRSLTHVSYDPTGKKGHNERLEFLGDAVLSLAISDLLMRRFPDKPEGDLSRMRAALVNAGVLAAKAKVLGLGELIHVSKGEERSGGRTKDSILSGTYEALFGGIYLDGGYEVAQSVAERQFGADLKETGLALRDFKTRLQEISQMLFHVPPTYTLVAQSGPDHAKRFVTEIAIGGKVLGRGEGKSKKLAEQEAARKALEELQESL